jgi:hypothetical protein
VVVLGYKRLLAFYFQTSRDEAPDRGEYRQAEAMDGREQTLAHCGPKLIEVMAAPTSSGHRGMGGLGRGRTALSEATEGSRHNCIVGPTSTALNFG